MTRIEKILSSGVINAITHPDFSYDITHFRFQKTRDDTLRIGKRYASRFCSEQTTDVSSADVRTIR